MNIIDLYKLKLGCLFHDPIIKTILISFEDEIKHIARAISDEEYQKIAFSEIKSQIPALYGIITLNEKIKTSRGVKSLYEIIRKTTTANDTPIDILISNSHRFGTGAIEIRNKKVRGIIKSKQQKAIGLYNIFSGSWKVLPIKMNHSKGVATIINLELLDNFKITLTFNNNNELQSVSDPISDEIKNIIQTLIKPIFNTKMLDVEAKWRLTYLIIWTLMDMIYLNKLPIPLPEDTRFPTTDIIDHIYACTTAANVYEEGKVILIDFAGIQDFVSSARKFADYWFNSWLISIFAWKIVEPFLIYYGPDILLRPTARLNPLWIFSLINYIYCLKQEIGNELFEKIIKEIGKRFNKLFNYELGEKENLIDYVNEEHSNNKILRIHPIFLKSLVPATLTIVIPKFEKNDLIKIREIFEKINDIKLSIEDDLSIIDLIELFAKKLWEKLFSLKVKDGNKEYTVEELFTIFAKAYKKDDYLPANYSIDQIINELKQKVPFSIRVIEENINIYDIVDIKNLENKIKEKLIKESLKTLKIDSSFFDPNISEGCYNKNTSSAFEKIFRYCSVCSKNPAIIVVESIDQLEKENKELAKKLFLPAIFKTREKLCPLCLLKRILSSVARQIDKKIYLRYWLPRIKNIDWIRVEEKNISYSQSEEITTILELEKEILSIPSLKEVAIYEVAEAIYKGLAKYKIKEKEEFWEKLCKVAKLYIFYEFGKREDFIEKLNNTEIINFLVEFLYEYINTEKWEDIKSQILPNLEKTNDINIIKLLEVPYFALVYADGDNIGKIFQIDQLSRNEIEEIIERIYSDLYNNNEIFVELGLINEKISEKDKQKIKDKIKDSIKKNFKSNIGLWSQISRALVVSSLIEIIRLYKLGMVSVVYAGGDDLKFLCPRSKILDAIKISKEVFHGLEHDGFIKIGNNYTPALGFVGRTYAVILAHPQYPLKFIDEEIRKLEKLKSKIKYDGKGTLSESNKNKNLLLVARITRSSTKEEAHIPFYLAIRWKDTSIKKVKEILYNLFDILHDKEIENMNRRRIYLLLDNEIYLTAINHYLNTINNFKEALILLLSHHFSKGIEEKNIENYFERLFKNINIEWISCEIDYENKIKEKSIVLFEILKLIAILKNVAYYEAKKIKEVKK